MRLTDAYSHRHQSVRDVLRHYEVDHLPPHLAGVSGACARLAMQMVESLPDDPELVVGLRKLLEAKDAFVRTAVQQHNARTQELPPVDLQLNMAKPPPTMAAGKMLNSPVLGLPGEPGEPFIRGER